MINPQEYSALKIIGNAVLNRNYNPFGLANLFEDVMDDQIPTYTNLKKMLPNYDLIYAIHSAAATVCDAFEALQQENEYKDDPLRLPRVIVFSSLPYDPAMFRGSKHAPRNLWREPRSLVALPHVATYASNYETLTLSSPLSILSFLLRLFWMWLDTYLAQKAWQIAGKRNDSRRAARGLPDVQIGNKYYWQNYPLLSMGGVSPFVQPGAYIADNATVAGSLKSTTPIDLSHLKDWIGTESPNKSIIYVCFGTGTKLSDVEFSNLAKMAKAFEGSVYRILFALRKEEQDRCQQILDKIIGSKPSFVAEGVIEYGHGLLRIDADVPQEALLQSDKVVIFVSHMGFGGYTEAVNGGVPMVAYPSGCDQWYNCQRAVEAGVAVRANPQMKDLDSTVIEAIKNDALTIRSKQLATEAKRFAAGQIILNHADKVATESGKGSNSICDTSVTSSSTCNESLFD